ncbi:uncharacterized protein [Euphorbia lathyris]|uniref:uncharacterized protein n=1 Tax=Euphorbia lathyris TaxID=212925 RepID=UPI003313679F
MDIDSISLSKELGCRQQPFAYLELIHDHLIENSKSILAAHEVFESNCVSAGNVLIILLPIRYEFIRIGTNIGVSVQFPKICKETSSFGNKVFRYVATFSCLTWNS